MNKLEHVADDDDDKADGCYKYGPTPIRFLAITAISGCGGVSVLINVIIPTALVASFGHRAREAAPPAPPSPCDVLHSSGAPTKRDCSSVTPKRNKPHNYGTLGPATRDHIKGAPDLLRCSVLFNDWF